MMNQNLIGLKEPTILSVLLLRDISIGTARQQIYKSISVREIG